MNRTNSDINKYAYALFEVAVQQNNLDKLNENIAFLKEELDQFSSELKKVHFYALDKKGQIDVATALLSNVNMHDLLVKFVSLLIHNHKIHLLESFIANWHELQLVYKGYTRIEITTAEELSVEHEAELNKYFTAEYGNKFFLDKKINSEIIGGIIIRAGGFYFDSSVIGKLQNLSNVMKG
ncbi:ATP synthase F1 subunit delta [Rickettsiales bacterium LUAb2]